MKAKPLVAWVGVLLFFFGLPLAGSIYFWNDAHSKIRGRALSYVRDSALPLLRDWNKDKLFDEVSVDGRDTFDARKVDAWREEYGSLVNHGEPYATRSYTNERDDNVWQFTVVRADCQFQKKPGKVEFLIVHKTTSATWQIEKMTVTPR